MLDETLKLALLARVYEVARETPLELAPKLSARTGNHVLLKREDQQPVFSFKLRGAYNKIASLTGEQLGRGVIAASAGNHAQGVALAAQRFGCRAVIVMPRTTPDIKVGAVRALGGEVVLFGDTYDEASDHAKELCQKEGLTYVHPYDDPLVIAGQGTIGLEILKQHAGAIDAIFIPVGGGGLLAGVGAVLKSLRPDIKIIAVEPEDAASMRDSLAAGERIVLKHVGRFADGVAVKQVGVQPFAIAKLVVDDCVTVDNDAICGAIKEIFEDRRAILEPAGGLAYAGLVKYAGAHGWQGKTLVAIACGANINFDSLRHVSERAEIGEGREAVLAVTIPEKPGSFRRFCRTIGARSVTEFNYRFADESEAHVFVGLRIKDRSDAHAVADALRAEGFPVLDLSDDEMAKLHLRHMVGGRAQNAPEEAVFRFEFPERAGALIQFLDSLGESFNISLFHYRNHGSDVGRVLVGFQVSDAERPGLATALAATGYAFEDETESPAYRMFLR